MSFISDRKQNTCQLFQIVMSTMATTTPAPTRGSLTVAVTQSPHSPNEFGAAFSQEAIAQHYQQEICTSPPAAARFGAVFSPSAHSTGAASMVEDFENEDSNYSGTIPPLASTLNPENPGAIQDHEELTVLMEQVSAKYTDDIRDAPGNSKKNKDKSALNHFNYFLKKYAEEKALTYVAAEDLTYENCEEQNKWWDEVIGAFFNYLAVHAKCDCIDTHARLAYETATGYASSVKSHYQNKFRTTADIPVFSKDRWKDLRDKLMRAYQEESRQSGKSITNPHVASTKEDREAIATGSIWMNNSKGAEFWHLNNSMTQFAGRGSEVSLNRREHITVMPVNEMHYRYTILQSKLKRHKNAKESQIPIFPHRDGMLQDWYFSLMYRIVMIPDDDSLIFPNFGEKAMQTNSDDKSDSKVSSLWSYYFRELYQAFKDLEAVLNQKLTSHCNKKGANQLMGEDINVSGLAQIFKSGWEVRGFHSVFDYVVGTIVMLKQAAKAVSGWTAKIGETVMGGIPPSLDDVRVENDKLNVFVEHLFIKDVNNHWSQPIRQILVATLLRHYEEFENTIAMEPSGDFQDPSKHLFVACIKQKLYEAGVETELFHQWQEQVKEGFFNRNLPALPIQNFPRGMGDVNNPFHNVVLDPRCFTDHINALTQQYMALHGSVVTLQGTVNNITSTVSPFMFRMKEIADSFEVLNARMEYFMAGSYSGTLPQVVSSPARSRSSRTSQSPQAALEPEEFSELSHIKHFSVSVKSHKDKSGRPVSDWLYYFFTEQAQLGYEKDKAEMDKKEKTEALKKERTRLKNQFQRAKKTVKVLLHFCEEYPRERPSDVGSLQRWEQEVKRLGLQAEQKMQKMMFADQGLEGKPISQNILLKSEQFTTAAESTLSFPPDTPEEALKFWFPNPEKKSRKRKAEEVQE